MALPPSEIEKRKLLANSFDRISTACVAAGVVAPVAAATYLPDNGYVTEWTFAVGVLCWLSAAFALHWFARIVLGGLDQ